jgi:hypothetical protein
MLGHDVILDNLMAYQGVEVRFLKGEIMKCANPNCERAGIDLPMSEFNENRRVCKDCDRKRARDYKKKKWAKRKRIINKHLGKECVVCGEKRAKLLRCHEIYGKPHPPLLDTPLEEVKANCESGRFVRVCARCHGKSHSLMDKGIVTWEVIKFYIREFLQTEPPFDNYAHLRAWHKYVREKIRVRQLPLPIEC